MNISGEGKPNLKITNVGVYPPPFGGVAIHIQRLREYLCREGIENEIIDCSRCNNKEKLKNGIKGMSWRKAKIYLFFQKRGILHFHNFSWKNSFWYYILNFKHCVILSLHNERFLMEIEKAPKILRTLGIKAINSVPYIIVDSRKCYRLIKKIMYSQSKIFVIPEFIPPVEIPEIDRENEVMEMKNRHKFLISSNAFQLCFHNGIDLYGVDMLIELTAKLNNNGMDVAFCFLLPAIGDNNYFRKLQQQVQKLDIKDKFMFITKPLKEASSLWQISDIVIRSTNTDGNSIGILESLSVKTPVVASDCVPRPKEVILFKTRNFDDLYEKTKTVLLNLNELKNKIKNVKIENNAYRIINLYKSILKGANK